MQNSTLLSKIEKFVLDSLNHRYNSQVKLNTFLQQLNLSESEIKNYDDSIEIKINEKQTFQKFVYRFPQTRIYYSLYQNVQFKIQFIDYFNVHLVVLEGSQNNLRLVNKSRLKGLELLIGQPIKNLVQIELVPSSPHIYFIAPKPLQNKYPSALHLLNEIREWEYNNHPIAKLKTENNLFLQTLDQEFAKINPIAQFGWLNLPDFDSPFLIYHLQLYLYLGNLDFLHKLLKRIFKQEGTKGAIKEKIFLNQFLRDFKHSLQLNQKTVPQWLAEYEELSTTEDADLDRKVLFKEFNSQQTLTQNLQQMWETMNVAALEIYWQQQVGQNPLRFWFFLQLSLQNHFYWTEQAFEKIYGWLPDEHKPYFRLLFQLYRFTYLELEKCCRCGTTNMLAHQQVVSFGRLQIAYHRFGKSIFSVFLDIYQDLEVKLDKHVQWHFDSTQNVLTIQPVLIKPPLTDPVFNFTQIQIDRFKIRLPLIWEQFTLQVNEIRLKWIRKKKRFQLSVKIPKQFKGQVSVDQLPINCDSVYAKYYFPIPAKKTEWQVSLNDDRGVRLIKPQAISNSLHVTGNALDVRGILHDTFNFKLEGSKRNRQVIGQKPETNPLFINKRPLKFELTARRCQPFTGQIEDFDLFLKNFFNTPAARLIHQLRVWTFENKDGDQLKRIFLDTLGFIPKIIVTSPEKFNPIAETLNLLISLKVTGEKVGNYQNFRVMQRKKHSKVKYLWINIDQLKKNLIDFYFMQKIAKI